MDQNSLLQKLLSYTSEEFLPMHMPGHKRCDGFPYLAPLPYKYDITEIDGFDDLNSPEGIFKESEELAAKLWGSDECIFSINGSSGGILAAIRGTLKKKRSKKILMSRGCHKSVYNGVELCRAEPIYLSSNVNPFGFYTEVSPREVERKLKEHPDTSLVIITSPTYEGVISDIREISRICHDAGVPLMVDEAHGAHLSLHGVFPDGAVKCGADVVVQSVHKTLPCLTQTAVVHLCGNLIDKDSIKHEMTVFQTTSPSYVLSASIDGAVRYLASDEGKKRLKVWYSSAVSAREQLKNLQNLSLYESERYDVSKFVLCGGGALLSDVLRREHKIELEMTSLSYVIAMTGAGDSPETLSRFVGSVLDVDKTFSYGQSYINQELLLPSRKMIPAEAAERSTEEIFLTEAHGKVSASYVYAYPPGVPIIVPGEICDEKLMRKVQTLNDSGISVRGIKNGKIKVIKE